MLHLTKVKGLVEDKKNNEWREKNASRGIDRKYAIIISGYETSYWRCLIHVWVGWAFILYFVKGKKKTILLFTWASANNQKAKNSI
jgi:hypothetical protein